MIKAPHLLLARLQETHARRQRKNNETLFSIPDVEYRCYAARSKHLTETQAERLMVDPSAIVRYALSQNKATPAHVQGFLKLASSDNNEPNYGEALNEWVYTMVKSVEKTGPQVKLGQLEITVTPWDESVRVVNPKKGITYSLDLRRLTNMTGPIPEFKTGRPRKRNRQPIKVPYLVLLLAAISIPLTGLVLTLYFTTTHH